MNVLVKASAITTGVLAPTGRRRRPGSAGAHRYCQGSQPGRSLRRSGSGAAGRHRNSRRVTVTVTPDRHALTVTP
jgi:hypothetical protein